MSLKERSELKQIILERFETTRRTLGSGTFGCVKELTAGGTFYAAKEILPSILECCSLQDLVNGYKSMSMIRHPNVVQFIGLCFLSDSAVYPLLVMEELDISLDQYLKNLEQNAPLSLKLSVLYDVAKGLLHLHERSPPIIHHDLTARNILITSSSMQAKISDIGNTLLIKEKKSMEILIKVPGIGMYMPPEAYECKSKYDSSFDIFSFANVMLYTITQTLPDKLLPATYCDHKTKELRARSEVERRSEYIDLMRKNHDCSSKHYDALQVFIQQCLSNIPSDR